MSGSQGKARSNGFRSRLGRVEKRRAPIEAAKPHVGVLPDWKASFRRPMTLAVAVLVGMLAVFAARLARFHLMGGTLAGDNPDFTMFIDGGVALAAAFAVLALLKVRSWEYQAAQAVGVIAMIGLMHNIVHVAPGPFGLLFSKQWTDDIVNYSEPGSIYLRGNYIVLSPTPEVEPEATELPKVNRGTG